VAGQYYVFGGQYTSGASVEWLREALGGVDYDTLIAEAEEVPPGSLGAFFLPHLRLANPPYDDPAARGAFVGLSTDVKRGALFRAVLEGLAYDSRNSLEPLLAHSGIDDLRTIYAIGGGTQNRLLMRIKATVSNQAITVVGVEEATSLGAAILGGIGAGVYADVPSALEELRYAENPVEPVQEEISFYDAAFRRVYGRIYPSLRGVHHEIQALQRLGRVTNPPLPRKPPLPFVPGHRHLHHSGWPCHAHGGAPLLRRIPVFLFDRHPDDYLTRLRGERS
jgi:xylulokinase